MDSPAWLRRVLVFDTETTGTQTEGEDIARVWELALMLATCEGADGSEKVETETIDALFNPGMPIPEDVRRLCHIDEGLLREIEAAHPFAVSGPGFVRYIDHAIERGDPIIAYNGYAFDWPILQAEMERAGESLPDIGAEGGPILLDPVIWVRTLHRGWRDRSLSGAHAMLCTPIEGNAHRAAVDCEMTLAVVRALVAERPDIFDRPLAEVWTWQEAQRQRLDYEWDRFGYYAYESGGQLLCGFGKNIGRPLSWIGGYCSWALKTFGDEMPEGAREAFQRAARGL